MVEYYDGTPRVRDVLDALAAEPEPKHAEQPECRPDDQQYVTSYQ